MDITRDSKMENKESKSFKNQDLGAKEMNILILGATGVGKSTWINGFVNFLKFKSLQEAEANDLVNLIPTQFTVTQEDYSEVLVSTGTDVNEMQATGQSATQGCKIYPFDIGNTTIRLIDTPGIGDTRGIDQDKANFQNILSTLSTLKEIHGICILMKPNDGRVTVMFRFCIKELLTYLHKNASRNIMFCFTNSRGTFYRPGDTLPSLKDCLKENGEVEIPIGLDTIYCYDSEAYRFLAAIKNKAQPVKFPAKERDNFSDSWEKSIEETKRMLLYISRLPPHPIQSTLNLNHARELVFKLARPLAEISKNIQNIKLVIEENTQEIEDTAEDIKELEKKKTYKKPDLKITELDYPKTVCTNSSCIKIYGGEIKQIAYTTICHDHCELGDKVPADTKGHPGLIDCLAMDDDGKCKICDHTYHEHLHCYYDSEEIMVDVVNESVKGALNRKISAKEMKQQMIDENERLVEEYDSELKQIEDASVKFACFLKHNAITVYNDAMLEYMDHLIQEERGKVQCGGSSKTLESLQIGRDTYTKKIEILEKELKKNVSDKVLSPTEVEETVKKLYDLKHNGKKLMHILKAVTETQKQSARSQLLSQYKSPTIRAYQKFMPTRWF